ncbi:MAG TPA: hypothetical protein VKJ45_02565 [Blastocatellia bacterium]|nr:hypothetical protein [Blastocatellia bacterium]
MGHFGVAFTADQQLPNHMLPFLRAGYCPAGAGRTSIEVDWGVVSVAPFERSTDRLCLGANWARLTPPSTHDQFAFEFFLSCPGSGLLSGRPRRRIRYRSGAQSGLRFSGGVQYQGALLLVKSMSVTS